ncbi:MBL fold metallo-hydrolase [Desulfobacterales bacterium HSG17]|nr:MBL fold metallo-hydrolase [Desulfobacterales bacterium HSG17]
MQTKTDKDFDLEVCTLASGSKGNCAFVSDGSTSILIDAGLSGIELERRLKSKERSPENIDAILISHEHGDHIQAAGVLSRRYNTPVYLTPKTWKAAEQKLGKISDLRHFECGQGFKIKSLEITPFSTSHDAEDPAGMTVRQNSTKIGIATDLGIATALVKEHLKNCSLLILEANHDPEMLMNGPYPWFLKQRVKSRTGHLSNNDSGELLKEILHEKLQHVLLGHLSEKNNTPHKALNVVGQVMNGCKAVLEIAPQDRCSQLITLKG